MGCWLSIYWNETLERLVHYFTQLTPVRKRNVKPSHEANRKDTASANDQYWEKDDVDEIEGKISISMILRSKNLIGFFYVTSQSENCR